LAILPTVARIMVIIRWQHSMNMSFIASPIGITPVFDQA
jgi:hypothetical protein